MRRAWRTSSAPRPRGRPADRARRLVDDAAHVVSVVFSSIIRSREPCSAATLLGRPARGAEQPEQDRHVVAARSAACRSRRGRRRSTRRPAASIAGVRLRPARDCPDRVALGGQRAGEVEPAAAAADDQASRATARRARRAIRSSRSSRRRALGVGARPRCSSAWPRAGGARCCASSIWSTSSISFCSSTSAERVGLPVELLSAGAGVEAAEQQERDEQHRRRSRA